MNKKIKNHLLIALLFVVSYVISQGLIKLLSPSNYFKSPMYILLPIVGFFAMFYFTPIIQDYIQYHNTYVFAIVFLILGVLAFYLATYMFFWNSLGILNDRAVSYPFWKIFFESIFLEFIVSGITGIFSSKIK